MAMPWVMLACWTNTNRSSWPSRATVSHHVPDTVSAPPPTTKPSRFDIATSASGMSESTKEVSCRYARPLSSPMDSGNAAASSAAPVVEPAQTASPSVNSPVCRPSSSRSTSIDVVAAIKPQCMPISGVPPCEAQTLNRNSTMLPRRSTSRTRYWNLGRSAAAVAMAACQHRSKSSTVQRSKGLVMKWCGSTGMRAQYSDVEPELDDVAVAHHVLLALDAHLAGGLGRGHRAGRHEVVVRHDLGLDEAALEVGVDDAGGLGGGRADRNHPGARLFGPSG